MRDEVNSFIPHQSLSRCSEASLKGTDLQFDRSLSAVERLCVRKGMSRWILLWT